MKKMLVLMMILCGNLIRLHAQAAVSSKKSEDSLQTDKSRPLHESVYLHFDRTTYNIGDTVWFKGLITAGDSHQLSELSSVLYVELINNQNSIVNRLVLSAQNGVTYGDFPATSEYLPGLYQVRAYTKYMLNDNAGYFFNNWLQFGVTEKSVHFKTTAEEVNFYPEGGKLINGIRSKVAIKVSGQTEILAGIRGNITDNEKKEIASFVLGKNGMGLFPISPVKGNIYYATLYLPDRTIKLSLPQAQDSGINMIVNSNSPDSINIKIAGTLPANEMRSEEKVRVFAFCKGNIYYTAAGNFSGSSFEARVAKNVFPPGVVQFVLLSSINRILSTRNVFIKTDDKLSIKIQRKPTDTATKADSAFRIIVKNNAGRPVNGSFAIAISKVMDTLNKDQRLEMNIRTVLDLTSNYNSEVENPASYFAEDEYNRAGELDMLMLTQEHFKYNENEKNLVSAHRQLPRPEKSLTVEGLVKTTNGNPVEDAKVSLFALSAGLKMDTITNEKGYFKFDGMDVPDSTRLLLNATKKGVRNINIYIAKPDYPPVDSLISGGKISKNRFTSSGDTKSNRVSTVKANASKLNGRVLKEVTVIAKKIEKPTLFNKYGTDNSYTIKGKDLTDFGSMMNGLKAKLPFTGYSNGKFFAITFPNPILHVVLNNVEIEPERINDYVNPYNVENVKILQGHTYKTLYGIPYDPKSLGQDDIILITTKAWAGTDKRTYSLSEVPLKMADETGVLKDRTFYTSSIPGDKIAYYFPGYTQQHTYGTVIKNNHTYLKESRDGKTVYWNPNLVTDSKGEAYFSFNPPGKGFYLIQVEGIDGEGRLGTSKYYYQTSR